MIGKVWTVRVRWVVVAEVEEVMVVEVGRRTSYDMLAKNCEGLRPVNLSLKKTYVCCLVPTCDNGEVGPPTFISLAIATTMCFPHLGHGSMRWKQSAAE